MFHPFQVEQFLSEHEQGVAYNFSESGVHPLTLGGLLELAGTGVEALSEVALDHPEVRGSERLRAEKDMLVLPGECFGLEHHFRFSSALPEAHLAEGLARLNALVGELLEGRGGVKEKDFTRDTGVK